MLLGCRRHADVLRIEVWDTGIGIPEAGLQAVFEEYHQLDNPARERSRGLGLGLSIVRRLAGLLGHRVTVRSRLGKGSVFTVEVPLLPSPAAVTSGSLTRDASTHSAPLADRIGNILIVEDDPELAAALKLVIAADGHHVASAGDGPAALAAVARSTPDILLADYNLPGGMDGIQLSSALRSLVGFQVPVIILTGDVSIETMKEISRQDCQAFNKPVKPQDLLQAIRRLLPAIPVSQPLPVEPVINPAGPMIYIVDDDRLIRDALRAVLEMHGHCVETFPNCESFLAAYRPEGEACLVVDAYMPGMNGLELLERLSKTSAMPPAIMITGHSDVSMAVRAMKAGASDFVEKPVGAAALIECVGRALDQARDRSKLIAWRQVAAGHLAGLTMRQREVMDRVLAGEASKNIAADLGISQRTVEAHRAAIMHRTGARSLPELARLSMVASASEAVRSPGRRPQDV